MNLSTARKLDILKNIKKKSQTLIGWNNVKDRTVGRAKMSVTIGLLTYEVKFNIVNSSSFDIILGLDVIKQFNLEQRTNGINQKINEEDIKLTDTKLSEMANILCQVSIEKGTEIPKEIEEILQKYEKIFATSKYDVGKFKDEVCRIPLENEVPINLRDYRHPPEDQERIKEMVKTLHEAGMISESNSPYSFPIILTNKKDDGEKTRMCIDYRKLNQITKTESCPFPLVGDILDRTLNCKYFTTLDVASGFHHVEIDVKDRPKTAFVALDEKYQWNVMPFGLKNAPSIFQRALRRILRKHHLDQFCMNYIDDILIFSKGFDEHLEHIQKVLDALLEENIKLKKSKCHFGMNEVNYLGHTIGHNMIKPLKSNLEVIKAIKEPKNVKELQSFIGHIQYYRQFINNCSKLMAPLTLLLKKGEEYKWTQNQQSAFEKIKSLLIKEPILTIFDPEKDVHIFTDASKLGIGAVLKQSKDGIFKPIQYYSKSLTSYQKNYTITELECLAIVEAVKHWRHYLGGRKFYIHSDHRGLVWLKKTKLNNSRLARWSIELSQYDYQIIYNTGNNNQEADVLSRNPIEEINITTYFLENEELEEIMRSNQKRLRENSNPSSKFVYPEFRKKLIEYHHKDLGHLSVTKLHSHIKQNYEWPKMLEDMRTILKNCEVCLKNKTRPPQKFGQYNTTEVKKPMEVIQLDSIGGMKQKGITKQYLHIAVDMFSKKVWCVSSKTRKNVDFVNLINLILKDGKPGCIRSDNYPGIISSKFRSFLKKMDIKYETTPLYSPQSIGLAERTNQTLVNQIRAVVNDPEINAKWPKAVKLIVDIYNNTKHATTNYSPNEIFNLNEDGLKQVQEKTLKSGTKNMTRINHGRIPVMYETGQKVLVKNEAKPNQKKLSEIYIGPMKIKKRISSTRYEVENEYGKISIHSTRNMIPLKTGG